MFQNINIVIRTLIGGALVGVLGWWTLFLKDKFNEHEEAIGLRDEQIATLTADVETKDVQIEELGVEIVRKDEQIETLDARVRELEVSIWLLKVDHRVARVQVVDQTVDPDDPEKTTTTVRFIELDPDGEPIEPAKEFTIDGKTLYIEGLVIKFDDDFVEGADELRGSSVAMFRRAFSENQLPSEGVELDSLGTYPQPYSGDDVPEEYFQDLWKSFWEYANDPEAAAQRGVRAIHGEAPFMELRPGKTYRVELRASGGLSIRAE